MNILTEKQAIYNAFADKFVSVDATVKEEIELDNKALNKDLHLFTILFFHANVQRMMLSKYPLLEQYKRNRKTMS